MTDLEDSKSRRRRVAQDAIALMARELVLVTLPHKDPGNVPEWTRQNGNVTLAMQPGYKTDPKDSRSRLCIGYPYGSTARLILYWIVTEARRTGNPRLELGRSLGDFMRKLGLTFDDSTGKRSSASSVHRQLERLISAHMTFHRSLDADTRQGREWLHMPVAKGGCLWWDVREEEKAPLFGSYIVLNDDFFKVILTQPVPVRMMSLLALKKSPLGLDLYAWATLESYKAQHDQQGRFIAWKLLHEQFGSELGRLDNFIAKAKRELKKILCNCPTLRLAFLRGGVQVLSESVPDVPPVPARQALLPPPHPPSTNAPSGAAITFVIKNLRTREAASIIAIAFQRAVERGAAENTDEAYIAFANQYVI